MTDGGLRRECARDPALPRFISETANIWPLIDREQSKIKVVARDAHPPFGGHDRPSSLALLRNLATPIADALICEGMSQ
jgi:hypothetical protein